MNQYTVKYATEVSGLQEGPVFDSLYKALAHAEMVCDEDWIALNPWVIEKFPNGVENMHTMEELRLISNWDDFFNKEFENDREEMERIIYYKSREPYCVTCGCGNHFTMAEASFDDHMAYCHETEAIAKRFDYHYKDEDSYVICRVIVCDCGRPVNIYIGTSGETMMDFLPEDANRNNQ